MSHGVPRAAEIPRSEEELRREEKRIAEYKQLDEELRNKVWVHELLHLLIADYLEISRADFSREAFDLSSRILSQNPEYYTVWNHRRRIHIAAWKHKQSKDSQEYMLAVEGDVTSDLDFIKPLMIKYPKCYWIWNFRLWLLEQSTERLSHERARALWRDELKLVEKMLGRDRRNFHGWRFRRIVVGALESKQLAEGEISLTKQELEYTTKMIGTDLSNYSAWHYRSKLIPRLLQEQASDDAARRKILDEELELIHEALIDPYDSSLWFYHQTLAASMSPAQSVQSIAPALTQADRLQYINAEIEFVLDILSEFDDCKWAYQSLIALSRSYHSQKGAWPPTVEQNTLREWLARLRELDPLRNGRWKELGTESFE